MKAFKRGGIACCRTELGFMESRESRFLKNRLLLLNPFPKDNQADKATAATPFGTACLAFPLSFIIKRRPFLDLSFANTG